MNPLRVRFATEDEFQNWNGLVALNPSGGDFVHTVPFAQTKSTVGWTPRYIVFERDGERVSVALVLERRIPLLGRYWYLPNGPAVEDPQQAYEHSLALHAFVETAAPSVFAATVEPRIFRLPEQDSEWESLDKSLRSLGALWRPGIQTNQATAVVSLQNDDALLASFQKRCRNSISRATRDGVEVREYPANEETFAHMHRLMRLVGGGGQNLRLRSEQYAERFWNLFSEAGLGKFYGIDVDGKPALLAFTIRVGARAYYKDGGSERPRQSPGMSNLLQWHMMRDVRDAGAKSYDMMGAPPRSRLKDPTAPNVTLAPFKLSFANEVTEFVGAWDLVFKPGPYRTWLRFGLPLTQRWHRWRFRDLDLF